jgi:hypothetical protein
MEARIRDSQSEKLNDSKKRQGRQWRRRELTLPETIRAQMLRQTSREGDSIRTEVGTLLK